MRKKLSKKKEEYLPKGAPDSTILIFAIVMAAFGVIMIYNASAYLAQQEFNDQFYFLKLQIIWLIISTIAGVITYFVDYHRIAKIILLIFLANVALLVLVLIFGKEINGARRWFEIGEMRLQPAELIKPVIIIYLGSWLVKYENIKEKVKNTLSNQAWKKSLLYCAVVGIVSVLIMLQPDMGTTLVIAATTFIMFFLFAQNKYEIRNMTKIGVAGVVVVAAAILTSPYRWSRVLTYLQLLATGEVVDPRGAGYQLHQILIGIGSSGLWGKGFGQSRQRFGYLVENTAFTDSTFAVVLEEFGIISAIIIIGAWLFFFFKGFQIARKAPDKLGTTIACGITIWLTLQALLNIAANIGIIPITGLPFPFLTYGGSSTIVTFVGIALLLNISQYGNKKEETTGKIKIK
jgi:cell division protein FtsW